MILPTKEEVKLCNIIDSSDSTEEEKKIAEKSSFEIRKENLKEMDEAGLELFSKQYNFEFSWEDKI